MFSLYWRPGKWRPPIETHGHKIGRLKLLYVLYTVPIQNRYRYFVCDYDLKQYVKTFFKRPAVFVFLERTQIFLGLQSVAQPGRRG